MNRKLSSLHARTALAALLLIPAAAAQSFNIDVGANIAFPTPPMAYPGAAGQPGYWNPVDGAAVNYHLRDLNNLTTLATISVAGGGGNFEFNNAGTAGANEDLYDDVQNVGPTGAMAIWTVSNLQNGVYEVFTYAWAPDNAAARTRVEIDCSIEPDQVIGGPWPGGHVYGVTFAVHRIEVSAGTLAVRVTTVALFGSVNGFQLRKLASTGLPGCFGDGTDNACPCANFGAPGHGCANSVDASGALLGAFGDPSVAADTVVLATSHMPPNTMHLYFQGTAAIQPCGAGCFGTPFGDGLRCVGGAVIRLGTKAASPCGTSTYPGPGEDPVSVKGGIGGFATRFYQVWYRNAAAFCTVDTFNLSNGYEVHWTP